MYHENVQIDKLNNKKNIQNKCVLHIWFQKKNILIYKLLLSHIATQR